MTFTRTHSPGLGIPDDTPAGVSSTLAVADDLEIADLDFRVDNLQHTYVGDVTVLLRAPNGYGADLIWVTGGAVAGGGDGDNFVNTVIDDAAAGRSAFCACKPGPIHRQLEARVQFPVAGHFARDAGGPDRTVVAAERPQYQGRLDRPGG